MELIENIVQMEAQFDLSPAQKRMWLVSQNKESSISYNIAWSYMIEGSLGIERFRSSFFDIVNRHESLRSSFFIKDQTIRRKVRLLDEAMPEFNVIDLRNSNDQDAEINKLVDSLVLQDFDIERGALLRAALVQRKDDDFLFILVMHHIASDGTSFNVFMTDLFAHYSGKELPAFKTSLSECLEKQKRLLHSGLREQESFWLEQFREKPGVLELPYDFSRPKVQGYTASNVYFSLGETETAALKALVRSERTTLFVTLLAAWKLLLHKLSQQEDIIVGVPFSGRKADNMDHVSMFVNTLPLRSHINPELSFKKYLSELTRMILEAYDNQDYPLEELYDKLKLKRDTSRNAVFDVMFVLHDKRRSLDVPGLTVKTFPLDTRTSPYDLLLETIDEGDKIEFKLQYNTGLFRAETVNRFAGFLLNILNAVSAGPATVIKQIELLGAEEKRQLLDAFTANEASYPKDKTIISLFEEQAERAPDRTAIVFKDEELTYRQLDERANQLGHYLKARGVQAETLVPICIERGIEMIVGILGILKAGGAYVPVDPDYPQQRIGYMIGDTNAGLVLCSSASRHSLSEQQGYELIELDGPWAEIGQEPSTKPEADCHPSSLAYVIYTSGSTGRPKGVMIEHRNVVRLFETDPKLYDFKGEDVWTMFHSFCFDFSVWEMYGALFYGGRLIVVPKDTARDTKLFGELIIRHNVTVLNQTPSAFYVLQDYLVERVKEVPVRYVIFGGEALNPAKLKPWSGAYPGCRLINMYGITETTVHVTYQPLTASHIDSTRSIIGKPIPTLNAYILNKEGQLCPVGIPGELYIGGAGVARGYLDNPDLTAQRFLPNPFREGDRLYRTGDLGRWVNGGDIEYLGRIDDQVKIRGYRIELGEIESVTNTLEEVSSSCVVIHKHLPVTNNLACYYVPSRSSLKKKEQELFRKRIDEWSTIYETEYAQEEEIPFGEDFNIVGWNDSFTGEAIPEAHMREWLDDILSVIRSQAPARVLEIGCGTGMIYYGISDCIRHYTGTDISSQTINRLSRRVSAAKGHPPARFLVAAAHEISFAENEEVDTVIFNSVIQYFPGEEYLSQVLHRCMAALNGHGRIIIGDVRDNRLLRAFHARVHRDKLLDGADIKEFRWFVEKEALKDKELCVSPEYFYHLKTQYPQITHIDIQWKKGDHINELTLYRYTAIIHVGIEKEIIQPDWQPWQDISPNTILENCQSIIAIKDIPNPRLWQERITEPVLNDPASKTLRNLLNDLSGEDNETAKVKALIASASAKGYACKFLLDEDPLKMNLVLFKGKEDFFIEQAYSEEQDFSRAVKTNIPLYSDITLDLQKAIRDQLLDRLPEYMVPAKFLAAGALPLTNNGKVDRAFLSRQDDIQAKHTDTYTAPRSEVEERLATIWSELLGVEQVGINDNFFELGGDSIITIQVISRARRWGYELQPRDLFTHQTISHLSKILSDRQQTVTGEQGILSGEVPLLPIQQWYFEQDQPNPSHFNQSMLLGLSKEIRPEMLEAATQELLKHHDALRFKYTRTETGWKQEYAPYKEQPIIIEDLRIPGGSLSERITACANIHQASLHIEKGELFRAVWMQTPADESHNRLLLVIHHLAVDGVSWRILLQDLELLLTGVMNGEKVTLGNKSSSIREWHKALNTYGNRKRAHTEYWNHILQQYKPLPTDLTASDEITAGDAITHIVSLHADKTQKLLQEVSRAYHTEINDVLLAALAVTLGEWSKSEQVSIGLEGHGREDIGRDVDVTRTVGWLTSIYPVVLKAEEDSPASLIKSIKEQLRSIPDKGIGYGVLKYLEREEVLQQDIHPDLVFNYLGQWDNMVGQSQWFVVAPEFSGQTRSPLHRIAEKIAINSRMKGGQLSLYWTYSSKHYKGETIQHLADRYIFHLERLILHCSKQSGEEAFTPSDYGLAPEVNYRELDQFLQQPVNGRPRKEQVESLYRLSGLQEGMLFHKLYDDRVNAYTEQFECELPGLNPEAFRESWQKIIRKHSIFRTGFHYDAFSIPVQCVYREAVIPFETLDFRRMDSGEQEEALDAFRIGDKTRPFDFEAPPLMRITLIRLDEERYYMFWTHHHIILDGWSVQVLMTELLEYYQALVSGGRVAVGEEDKYEDYIRYIARRDKEEEEEFWKSYLWEAGEGTLLPFIRATEERNKGIGSYRKEVLQLDSAATASLSAFAQEHRVTLNTLMQGAWAYLLYRYTGNAKVTFGVTVSGRPDDLPDVENRVGIYINTLPFHVAVNEEQKIAEWLKHIQQHQLQSRSHQHTPLPHIRQWAGVQGDWFDSYLAFENYPVNKILETRNWALKMGDFQVNEQTNYPLSIIIEAGEEISILFTYNASLLDEYYTGQIKSHFANLLEQMVRLSAVAELSLDTDVRLFESFNQNEHVVDGGENTLVVLISQQALRTPGRIAIGFEGKELSYAELDARSNQLAHYLIQRGVKADTLVPICIDRSVEMMVGILGILKAGGAYVPIDPEYPQDRIEYMLSDTAASLVVCSSESHSALPQGYEAVELDGDWSQISSLPRQKPEVELSADNLAYVIYTSGSTGRPKGVMIEHRGVVNRLLWAQAYYKMSQEDVFLQKTTFSFDVSVWELFWPLLIGARLELAKPGGHKDQEYLRNTIERSGVTIVHFVPSMLEVFLLDLEAGACAGLKKVLCSGEALKSFHVQLFRERMPHAELHNLYGPTEASIDVTYWSAPADESDTTVVPIGRPVSNTRLYILDALEREVAVGVPGELYIGGIQVARGYLNLPQQTKERFITRNGERLYKTGDLCRWLPDGNIEYLGRLDDQLKVRGYRIEPAEIETVLLQSGLVSQAVVVAKEDASGNKQLVGYVVPSTQFNRDAIKTYLQERLPEYMVPTLFVSLKELPLTSSGKVDKKALPKADTGEMLADRYLAPQTELEKTLATAWQDVLGVKRVGIRDNFLELGGHSLLAIRLISVLRRELGIALTIKDLFVHSTVQSLARHIGKPQEKETLPAISVQERPHRIPLSFGQERIWFLDQLEGSVSYHIPMALHFDGDPDISALTSALKNVINRHEVLRTVLEEEEGLAYQRVLQKDSWTLELISDPRYYGNPEAVEELIQQLVLQPFDLSSDHKLRAHLVRTGSKESILVITIHHIAFDGLSLPIILREFKESYAAYAEGRMPQLPELTLQYADYSIWQREYLTGERLSGMLQYWKEKLAGSQQLDLPADYPRPPAQSQRGAALSFTIEPELAEGLKKLSLQQGTTLYMTLLAAFKVLLYRYSGQEDISVGTPVGNRQYQELENLVGFFVNTIVLRSNVGNDPAFRDFLQQVKDTLLEAYAHQEAPFEKVVEAIVTERDMSRSPLFQVMFVLQSDDGTMAGFTLPGVNTSFGPVTHTTSKFDLLFDVKEEARGLAVFVEYATDLFKEDTVTRIFHHYKQLLKSAIASPSATIGSLSLLSAEEQEQLSKTFNQSEHIVDGSGNTLVHLISQQALRTPGRIAIGFEGKELSYAELDARSSQLAHYLIQHGVKADTLVPICIDRSVEMMVGILGILKAGGAYVPIDPEYPQDRIEYMLSDTAASLVLCSSESHSALPKGYEAIELDGDWSQISSLPRHKPQVELSADNLAYVIYTSGSTGRPKGVMIEHRGVVNRLLWAQAYYKMSQEDVFLQKTTFSFDVSVWELFWPLLIGARLELAKPGGHKDQEYLRNIIERSGVSIVHFVPSMLEVFLLDLEKGACSGLKKVLCSGEALKSFHVQLFRERLPHTELHNLYGPTEASIDVTYWSAPSGESDTTVVPIGKPVSNTRLYILDALEREVAVGVPGELYIGGIQVARGYLNLPQQTKERFITRNGERLYKTGDLCRWLPDGNIEYLGRLDDQLKVRGYRIEPAEIETVLLQSGLVSQAVVVAKEDANDKKLVAYYTSAESISTLKLRKVLNGKLPPYFIPSFFIRLDEIPLTASGKVNRKHLQSLSLESSSAGRQVREPETGVEKNLVAILKEILSVEKVSMNDDFFSLGGSSILVIRAIALIKARMGVRLSIRDFMNQSLSAIARKCEQEWAAGQLNTG
jgi:amino acid adenylation domain-containing protein/non-ribosomal peptide synthase protein (TIGR01720 family)